MASDTADDRVDAHDGLPHVGLFATCLVDIFRPQVGFAAVKLLEQSGCRVSVPLSQTCCGQPAHNSGDRLSAREIAASVIDLFEPFDYVVAPSGSCAAMIKCHYPDIFASDGKMAKRADRLASRTYELISFLVDNRGLSEVTLDTSDQAPAQRETVVAYHDSCSGLRELKIHAQPRLLLGSISGVELREFADADICCGFGGTFCVKYPEISNRMVEDKTAAICASGATTLLGGDMGCLLNVAGKLKRLGSSVQTRHVAELLAGMADGPAIGEPATGEPATGEKD
jgi:L-lactate dehydrogenase complex protein LldE